MILRPNEWILSFLTRFQHSFLLLFFPIPPSPFFVNPPISSSSSPTIITNTTHKTTSSFRPLMAAFTNLIVKPPQNLCSTTKLNIFSSHYNPKLLSLCPTKPKTPLTSPCTPLRFVTKATAAASNVKKGGEGGAGGTAKTNKEEDKVQRVHTVEEFEAALRAAKQKLVVVEYATSHSEQSSKMYPFMVNLSRTCSDVVFLLVMGDESEETRELCRREKIEKVPHFSFYKSMEKIHDEEGIGPDMLMGDVLYYGDNHSGVVSTLIPHQNMKKS